MIFYSTSKTLVQFMMDSDPFYCGTVFCGELMSFGQCVQAYATLDWHYL